MQDIVGIEIGWLEANRLFSTKTGRCQEQYQRAVRLLHPLHESERLLRLQFRAYHFLAHYTRQPDAFEPSVRLREFAIALRPLQDHAHYEPHTLKSRLRIPLRLLAEERLNGLAVDGLDVHVTESRKNVPECMAVML
jgi:hypothetical protein